MSVSPEGPSAEEVGNQIPEHKQHHAAVRGGKEAESERRDGWISIIEAAMLSFVAVLAAYSV